MIFFYMAAAEGLELPVVSRFDCDGGYSVVSIFDQICSQLGRKFRRMKYFFHLEDGSCIRDPTGTDFLDDAAAMLEAAKVADELSRLPVHQHDWSLVVKNADGLRVGSVPLSPSLEGVAVGDPAPSEAIH